jgi:hypothetical protein
MKYYYTGDYQTWLIIDNHTLPLSLAHAPYPLDASWKYIESSHTLTYCKENPTSVCTFSWLSAKLVTIDLGIHEEHDMDPFLEKLQIHTSNVVPSLHVIFLAWCAHTKHWLAKNGIVQFHIIDHEGNERMLSLQVDSTCLQIRNSKLYDCILSTPTDVNQAYTYYHA